jgi:predicted nucleotidyltransferase
LSSAEARYLKINYDEVLCKLREYAKAKAGAHETRAIVLTGSLAKESFTGTSDADILVIADRIPCLVLERYALFAEPRMPIDVEPRVYTTKEFISKVRQGDRFALESLKIGIPLHGEQFFEDLKRSLKKKRSRR